MQLHHVELFVQDVEQYASDLEHAYGFQRIAHGEGGLRAGGRSAVLQRGSAVLLVTQGLEEEHLASAFVRRHGDGVGDLALGVADAGGAYRAAVHSGARGVEEPRMLADGTVVASIRAFGDVIHTFVQSAQDGTWTLPGFTIDEARREAAIAVDTGDVLEIDHFAVCLEAGTLDSTVDFYREAVGFKEIFEEEIVVGAQGMISKVVQSPSGEVTLTLIEPDVAREPGQIDRFLKDHDGSGTQHIAFRVDDAVLAVSRARDNGVVFLSTPAAYYRLMRERLELSVHTLDELERNSILVDEDHDGQLFQIFTRSTHDRRTLFFEVIERVGATTFGSGNIKALYEAVEAEKTNGQVGA
ncbi:4-hydroxyphenylpyruvate dioxygenase [Streptomyces sp. NBC_00882]|uniref:4-hydroxyphenylpyruvate dioxygenase n=1 Tax=Streptomyces sp. NBC_00882 TaxID=2975856 RepID=UPI0038674B48|nr:4-hydroxyphenylpyruvate dioxygenase [Streptomyces sp. NBC_00882]